VSERSVKQVFTKLVVERKNKTKSDAVLQLGKTANQSAGSSQATAVGAATTTALSAPSTVSEENDTDEQPKALDEHAFDDLDELIDDT
jgi:hypothetical protein